MTDTFVSLSSLNKNPVIQQLYNIMIQIYRSIQYFSTARIYPRGTHCIFNSNRRITNTRVFQIIRIKFRIIFRKFFSLDSLYKTYFFKWLIPLVDSFKYRCFPTIRETTIYIKNNRLHRCHLFTLYITF